MPERTPQRHDLDPQRLDQPVLHGQPLSLRDHQRRQLPIRGHNRRLGHPNAGEMSGLGLGE
jgi:hypothetical protein